MHGFGDTPQTLSLVARRLAKAGYGVLAPLLPGHGRNMDAFRRSRADEWVDAARESLLRMRNRYTSVSVLGLSMGGALAVVVAAERTTAIASVVLIAPYLGMPIQLRVAAATHWLWGSVAGEINARKREGRPISATGAGRDQLDEIIHHKAGFNEFKTEAARSQYS